MGRQGVYTLGRFKGSVGQSNGSYDRAIGFVYGRARRKIGYKKIPTPTIGVQGPRLELWNRKQHL